MQDDAQMMAALDRRVERRTARRELFRYAIAGVAAAGMAGVASRSSAQAATITDADVLNFALNLEYLEAQFYSYAANGVGLSASDLGAGSAAPAGGAAGSVVTRTGETGQPRAVLFTDSTEDRIVRQYAREIAADELAHVRFLRGGLTTAAVAQPAIDISGGASGAFTAAARAAGLIDPQYAAAGVDVNARTFDPYANSTAFLLGAFIFEDVGVTAYRGGAGVLPTRMFLQAAAGILSVEANHAAIIRTSLYASSVAVPQLITAVDRISNARDSLDGTSDLDQGIAPTTVNGQQVSNLVPTDTNGLTLARTPQQVLNIVYLNNAAASMGGFFPAGMTGTVRASTTAA